MCRSCFFQRLKCTNTPQNVLSLDQWSYQKPLIDGDLDFAIWKTKKDLVSIGLPCDGDFYIFNNREDLIEKLDELKELGYNFLKKVFQLAKEWKVDNVS